MTPTDLAGLCERLRANADSFADQVLGIDSDGPTTALEREAAAAIESLVAENERMREALEPFADVLADVGQDEADADLYRPMSARFTTRDPIRIGALRRARTALEGASDDR